MASASPVEPAGYPSKGGAGAPRWRLYHRRRDEPQRSAGPPDAGADAGAGLAAVARGLQKHLDFTRDGLATPPPGSRGSARGRAPAARRAHGGLQELSASSKSRGRPRSNRSGLSSGGSSSSSVRSSSAYSMRSAGSQASMRSARTSGLSVQQARDFSRNLTRHRSRLKGMAPMMRVVAPLRPDHLVNNSRRAFVLQEQRTALRRENKLHHHKMHRISQVPSQLAHRPPRNAGTPRNASGPLRSAGTPRAASGPLRNNSSEGASFQRGRKASGQLRGATGSGSSLRPPPPHMPRTPRAAPFVTTSHPPGFFDIELPRINALPSDASTARSPRQRNADSKSGAMGIYQKGHPTLVAKRRRVAGRHSHSQGARGLPDMESVAALYARIAAANANANGASADVFQPPAVEI